ncbi:hypothetical protein [Vibrio coralliilyticus]|uniref:hypothetical protein n=1 Tax=Vibrio coralliilyticus TaxID=190893 RepID=UPI001E50BBA5|nr:hypothetical protein [Vibrio coralliilyticus]MCC2522082.1 hypothetical protein [Vibrio coralliilyticus]
MINSPEIIDACSQLGIDCRVLSIAEARAYISKTVEHFTPTKTSGHLSIDNDSISLSIEDYEYSYSSVLPHQRAYLFFDQKGKDRNSVIEIGDSRAIGRIMENTFGMEYFVSNSNVDYLICVNWYAVEIKGSVEHLYADLV